MGKLFSGRLNAKGFLIRFIALIVAYSIITHLPALAPKIIPQSLNIVIGLIYFIFLILSVVYLYSLSIRRLHDLNFSGIFALILIIISIAAFYEILFFELGYNSTTGKVGYILLGFNLFVFFFLILKNGKGSNKYGPEPKGELNLKLRIGVVILIILALGGQWGYNYRNRSTVADKDTLLSTLAVSPNGEFIAFEYEKSTNFAIYTANIDGSNPKKLLDESKTSGLAYLRFTPDNSKLLVTGFDWKNQQPTNGNLKLINLTDSTNKNIPLPPGVFVLDAVFSNDGKIIYFLGSTRYGSYSAVYPPGFHDVDIYSMDTDGSNVKNLTNKKYYGLSNLNLSKDGKYLSMHVEGVADTEYIYPIDNPEKTQTLYFNSIATGNLDRQLLSIGDTLITPDYTTLLYVSNQESSQKGQYTYDLYKYDVNSKKTVKITNSQSYIAQPKIAVPQQKILFFEQSNFPNSPALYQLWESNLDGTDQQKINISI